ncbi:uncharacterized protein KZ484_010634 [Pholidichthys leucotaenia]
MGLILGGVSSLIVSPHHDQNLKALGGSCPHLSACQVTWGTKQTLSEHCNPAFPRFLALGNQLKQSKAREGGEAGGRQETRGGRQKEPKKKKGCCYRVGASRGCVHSPATSPLPQQQNLHAVRHYYLIPPTLLVRLFPAGILSVHPRNPEWIESSGKWLFI